MGKFIHKDIVKEIQKKLKIIEENSRWPVSVLVRKYHERSVEADAVLHSYKIEHPITQSNNHYNTHANGRKHKKGLKSLKSAFIWGFGAFNPETIDEKFIGELAGKIDPEVHNKKPAKYRDLTSEKQTGVRPSGATWTAPYPAKVSTEMQKFVLELREQLNQEGLCYNLESAIYSHLHLVRIHPFEDTNGRTARALQNIILRKNGLPPPIIFEGERRDYYDRLDRAINDWRIRTGTSEKHAALDERAFYDYIAGRVSASLDMISRDKH